MKSLLWLACIILVLAPASAQTPSKTPVIDLTNAVVVSFAKTNTPESKAVHMLVEEVEKRTRIRWPVSRLNPKDTRPLITVGSTESLHFEIWTGSDHSWNVPEGYQILTRRNSSTAHATVVGADSRGARPPP